MIKEVKNKVTSQTKQEEIKIVENTEEMGKQKS
jgi:hypothetical protein